MGEIITPTALSVANLQQLDIHQVMAQSLQVFRFEQEFDDAIGMIRTYDLTTGYGTTRFKRVEDLVKVEDRYFVAERQAKTREERFQVHVDAYAVRDQLPSIETLVAAHKSVKAAMSTRPSEPDLILLVGKVLDFWLINSDTAADYGAGLTWKFSECPRQSTERLFHRRKSWLSVPVIAAALNHMIDTYRPAFAKPPHLPDVLLECGKQSDRLLELHDNIERLGRTHGMLTKLIKFTNDSYPDEDDDGGS
jgi:hypothetical protein